MNPTKGRWMVKAVTLAGPWASPCRRGRYHVIPYMYYSSGWGGAEGVVVGGAEVKWWVGLRV